MLNISRAPSFHLDSDELTFSIEIGGKTIQAHYITHFEYGFGKVSQLNPATQVFNEETDCVLVLDEPIDGYDLKAIERATELLCQVLFDSETLQKDYAFNLDHLQTIHLDADNNITYTLYDGDNDVTYSA